MAPVLIRQHVDSAPAGLLAEWLEARGLAYEVQQTWVAPSVPDPADYAFVASLGHDRMAGDVHDPGVAAERELLTRAVERDVPVLGLCYGGQVLAAVLGAEVGPAPVPELGWRVIETDDAGADPGGAVARVALRALLHAAGRDRARPHRRRAAGVPARPAPRRAVPPRGDRGDRRGRGRGPTGARACRWPPRPAQREAARRGGVPPVRRLRGRRQQLRRR